MVFVPARRVASGNLSISSGLREDAVTRAGKAFIRSLREAGGNATGRRVPHGTRAYYLVQLTRLPTDRIIERRAREAAASIPGVAFDRGQGITGTVPQGNCFCFYRER